MEYAILLGVLHNLMVYAKHVHKDTNLEEMEFVEFLIVFK